MYGRPDHSYGDLIAAAEVVRARLGAEPGLVDIDDTVEVDRRKMTFVADKEKAALHGVSVADIVDTFRICLEGAPGGTVHVLGERNPLRITLRLPRALRSSTADLSQIHVKGRTGELVSLAELGRWEASFVEKTIYHKNLQHVVYVVAETAGRPPADAVVDVQADRTRSSRIPEEIDARRIGDG